MNKYVQIALITSIVLLASVVAVVGYGIINKPAIPPTVVVQPVPAPSKPNIPIYSVSKLAEISRSSPTEFEEIQRRCIGVQNNFTCDALKSDDMKRYLMIDKLNRLNQ